MEVDIGKGLSEVIQLILDGWTYTVMVEYEQFKCKYYHEYGHFAKKCPKSTQENPDNKASKQWQQAKREKINK